MSAHDTESLGRQPGRTRDLIRQAFLELLFEQDFPAVTMTAVAERANIGRSTLYEHFRTKDALFRDTARWPMSGLAGLVSAPAPPHDFGDLLQHFRENRALCRVLIHLPAYATMQKVLAELIEARLGGPLRLPPAVVATQIAAAQFALLIPWVMGQAAATPADMAQALHRSSNAIANALLV
jgi:AcrR family transcriptional regulator